MRVVLTKKTVVGHVMRYPGEIVDVPDEPAAVVAPEDARPDVSAGEFFAEKPRPRGRKGQPKEDPA